MISENLTDQIKIANKNIFVSKEITSRLDLEEAKTNSLSFYIKTKEGIDFKCSVNHFKNKKKYYKLNLEMTKHDIASFLKSNIKHVALFLKHENILKINTDQSFLEYSITKKDINSYILKLKIKKEK